MAKGMIQVPELRTESGIVIPAFSLPREISRYNESAASVYPVAPTLAELRHAYFGRNSNGSPVSPEYRESVLSTRGKGEWTSTFVEDGKYAITRPERVFNDSKHGWVAEGRKERVDLPNSGWVLEYDIPTGLPSRTGSKEEAEKIFGDDRSYFWLNRNGLKAVFRVRLRSLGSDDPFDVYANWEPGGRPSDGCGYLSGLYGSVGVRVASRHEQGAERLANDREGDTR